MKEKSDEILIFMKFIKNIHVVNNLKANFLININILDFENVIINISKKKSNFYKVRKCRYFYLSYRLKQCVNSENRTLETQINDFI